MLTIVQKYWLKYFFKFGFAVNLILEVWIWLLW